MEVLSAEYGSFHAVSPDLSPLQSPASTSPIPDHRLSPRNAGCTEQSLNIIVEPHLDGQTNFIYLMNPMTGQILSSFMAEHGAHIEIQHGVFFRVPFPHEHGYPAYQTGPPMQQQPQAYQSPIIPNSNIMHTYTVNDTNLHPNANNTIPCQQYNPQCPMHGSPGHNINTNHQYSSKDERLDKRREKLQKKLKEKKHHQSQCTCYTYPTQYPSKISSNENEKYHRQGDSHHDVEEIVTTLSPMGKVVSPYSVEISWDVCVAQNNQLLACLFELQQLFKGNTFKTIYSGSDTFRLIKELTPGTDYSFRVCAVLNGKSGPYSELVTCTTYCSVPDRPTPPRITQKTKNSMTLKWTVPSEGGSPITHYKLQWSKGEGNTTFNDLYVGLQKQYKHSHKLPPGTLCSFRLQAANSIGASDFSQILECLTSATPPAIPDRPTMVESGTDFITLVWQEPESHGSTVDEYKLEMEDPNNGYGFIGKYCGDAKTFCCQGLRRNTCYKFRLLASNNQGSSKYCAPVLYSTLPEPPGKMDKPKVNGKAKPFAIPVKWDLPKDTGGDEISGYILEIDDGKGGDFEIGYNGMDKECMVEELLPGHTYRLRVTCESKAGMGTWSPVAHITTLPICPKDTMPPKLGMKPEINSLYLQWEPPLDIGGAPITSYVVKMTKSLEQDFQEIYHGSKQNCLINELHPGTNYYFKSQASNSAGASPWSTVSTLQTAPGPPDAVNIPSVTFKSPTCLRFDWEEPVLHGSSITSYCIEKLENEVFQKVFQGSCLTCEIKRNILPASTYYFRLQAISDAGSSPYSNICTVESPAAAPGPVTDIKIIEQTSNSCLIQWHHPIENGSPVYEYVLEATGVTSILCTVQRSKPSPADNSSSVNSADNSHDKLNVSYDSESDSDIDDDLNTSSSYAASETSSSVASKHVDDLTLMEYRLTGLTADASYRLRIQAVNHIGAGSFSNGVQFFTKELPPSPPALNSSSISYHSIKLKWADSSSSSKKSIAVLSHTLQMQNKSGSFTSVYNGMGTSFTMSKLKELTPYCFRIRSKNDAGEGEFSKPKIFYTKAQPPAVIKDLKSENISESSIQLYWSPCDKIRTDDWVEYLVQQLHEESSKDFTQVYRGKTTKCIVNNLKPDHSYRFRVHAIRHVSEETRSSIPSNIHEEVKGVFSPIYRVKTLSVEEFIENEIMESAGNAVEQTERVRLLTDTHLALIILGSFLGVCAIVAVLLKWVLKEFY